MKHIIYDLLSPIFAILAIPLMLLIWMLIQIIYVGIAGFLSYLSENSRTILGAGVIALFIFVAIGKSCKKDNNYNSYSNSSYSSYQTTPSSASSYITSSYPESSYSSSATPSSQSASSYNDVSHSITSGDQTLQASSSSYPDDIYPTSDDKSLQSNTPYSGDFNTTENYQPSASISDKYQLNSYPSSYPSNSYTSYRTNDSKISELNERDRSGQYTNTDESNYSLTDRDKEYPSSSASLSLLFLKMYINQYPLDINLFENPVLYSRITRLVGYDNYRFIQNHHDIETPVTLIGNRLYIWGCGKVNLKEECEIYLDLTTDKLMIKISSNGNSRIYLDE